MSALRQESPQIRDLELVLVGLQDVVGTQAIDGEQQQCALVIIWLSPSRDYGGEKERDEETSTGHGAVISSRPLAKLRAAVVRAGSANPIERPR